jgi:VanZ family protein
VRVGIGASAFLLLAAVALAHRYSPDRVSELADAFVHSLHGPGFVVLALAILLVLQFRHRQTINYVYAAAISMAIGFLAEAAQIPGPRDAQIEDLVVDGLGIVGALGTVALFDREVAAELKRTQRLAIGVTGIIALATSLAPAMWYSYAWLSRTHAFPQLVTFEHRWERAIVNQMGPSEPELVAAPSEWPGSDQVVAHVVEDGPYGALIRVTPHPDWTGYSTLSFVAASTDPEGARVMVDIRDILPTKRSPESRYSRTIRVDQVPREYVIDLAQVAASGNERPFDISRVATINLSAEVPGDGIELWVDNFRLE